MRHFTITIALLLAIGSSHAQDLLSQIENLNVSQNKYSYSILLKNIKQANTELERAHAFNELAWFYNHDYEKLENPDSSTFYAKQAQNICENVKETDSSFAMQESRFSQQMILSAQKKRGAPRDSVYKVFSTIKKLSLKNGENRNLAEAYYNLGKYAPRWDSAEFFFQKAIELSDSLGYYNTLGLSFANLRIRSKASGISNGKNAFKAFNNGNNYVGIPHALIDIGKIYVVEKQEDSSDFYFNKAIEIAEQLQNHEHQASIHIKIAWVYIKFDELELALHHFNKAVQSATYAKDDGLLAASYNGLGGAYYLQNDYPMALTNYLKAEPLFSKTKNAGSYAAVLHNIGRIYSAQFRYKLAIRYLNLAIKENIRLENANYEAGNYSALAKIYLDQSEYKTALKYYRKTRVKHESVGAYNHLDTLGIGQCFVGLKQYQKAYECYTNAQKINDLLNPNRKSPNIPWRLSQLFFKLHNEGYSGSILNSDNQTIKRENFLSLAKNYIEQVLALEASFQGYPADKAQQAKLYSKILFANGNYEKAYTIRVESQKLQDSVFNMEKERDIAHIEYAQKAINDSLKFAQKENVRILELNSKNERLSRQKIGLIIAFLGLVILSVLVIWVLKSRQQIAKQDREKEVLLQEIHHRVKNNLSVIISMLRLQLRRVDSDSDQKVLKQIIGRVKTMSLIHQNLYQSENMAYTNFKLYLQELMEQIMSSFQDVSDITYSLEGDVLKFETETSIPLALISFEWVNNIYKHAFDDKNGHISINMIESDKHYELSIADNGKGISKEEFMASKDSLGAKIIRTLSSQVGAELFIERRTEGGAE
ncbi:MAG: tetratricopeptide repeat-containing sensor histidine kinase, partial [Bacteroidia bacterium]